MSVLVYIDNTNGTIKKSALEAVSYAADIAKANASTLTVVAVGAIDNAKLVALGKQGATKVMHATNDKLNDFNNQVYADIMKQVAEKEGSNIIVFSSNANAKSIAPRLAIKLSAAVISEVTELPSSVTPVTVKKKAFSNKAFMVTESTAAATILTLAPNSYHINEDGGDATVETFSPTLNDADFGITLKEKQETTGTINLPDAELVVSAGRGLKGPENWGMIEELAKLLGAATACSKPVSDADWRPHHEHVGQTGLAIAPNLYIAIGISGAIQHLAGVSSSKVMVVINTDAEAPFFKAAHYGIVGDAFEVVPKMIEAVKKLS
jgi:electron transfer flavoprotein alpha subunit